MTTPLDCRKTFAFVKYSKVILCIICTNSSCLYNLASVLFKLWHYSRVEKTWQKQWAVARVGTCYSNIVWVPVHPICVTSMVVQTKKTKMEKSIWIPTVLFDSWVTWSHSRFSLVNTFMSQGTIEYITGIREIFSLYPLSEGGKWDRDNLRKNHLERN